MTKNIIFLLTFALITNIFTTIAFADNGSYQAPVVNTLTIDKKIMLSSQEKGGSAVWQDNIAHDQYPFSLGESIYFQVTVHNPTNHNIENVTFTDRSPWVVNLNIEGASYDSSSHSYTVSLGSLQAGESKTLTLSGNIRQDGYTLPNTEISCLDNYVFASASGVALDDDQSNFCIKKSLPSVQVVSKKPTQIPSTGAPLLLPLLAGAASMFAVGKKLIREN